MFCYFKNATYGFKWLTSLWLYLTIYLIYMVTFHFPCILCVDHSAIFQNRYFFKCKFIWIIKLDF